MTLRYIKASYATCSASIRAAWKLFIIGAGYGNILGKHSLTASPTFFSFSFCVRPAHTRMPLGMPDQYSVYDHKRRWMCECVFVAETTRATHTKQCVARQTFRQHKLLSGTGTDEQSTRWQAIFHEHGDIQKKKCFCSSFVVCTLHAKCEYRTRFKSVGSAEKKSMEKAN